MHEAATIEEQKYLICRLARCQQSVQYSSGLRRLLLLRAARRTPPLVLNTCKIYIYVNLNRLTKTKSMLFFLNVYFHYF